MPAWLDTTLVFVCVLTALGYFARRLRRPKRRAAAECAAGCCGAAKRRISFSDSQY